MQPGKALVQYVSAPGDTELWLRVLVLLMLQLLCEQDEGFSEQPVIRAVAKDGPGYDAAGEFGVRFMAEEGELAFAARHKWL